MRSLIERIVSGEISESQAEEMHERDMGRLELNFLMNKTKNTISEQTRHETACYTQPRITK